MITYRQGEFFSFSTFIKRWWQLGVFGAILSFFMASLIMSGFPDGFVPNTKFPFVYQGNGMIAYEDGLSYSLFVQRVLEGGVYGNNERLGYPFGSNFLDFPSGATFIYLILKGIGVFAKTYFATTNLFFLLSFPAIFLCSFFVLCYLGIDVSLAFAGAILFNFLPFHFLRFAIGHMSYVWYATIPIFFYIAFSLVTHLRENNTPWCNAKKYWPLYVFGLLILASCETYYLFFAMMLIAIAGIFGAIKNFDLRPIKRAIVILGVFLCGFVLNITPNLNYQSTHGKNPGALVRFPVESEIVGLRLTQLLFPTPHHSQKTLADVTARYSSQAPFINENQTSALGLIGGFGFLFLGACILLKFAGKLEDYRLELFALLVYILFIWGTIGGFSSVFAFLVSPTIRSWNRMSIFIAFGSIGAFLILLQHLIQKFISKQKQRRAFFIFAVVVLCFGIFDQVPYQHIQNFVADNKHKFILDKNFIESIESSLPPGSAVYQLPYLPFPESGLMNRMPNYAPASGFLNSKTLKWNYGGFKDRKGDLFFRSLANESIENQLATIRKLGFSGIYIDRRAYHDNAQYIIEMLSTLLQSEPANVRADGEIIFFKLNG